MNKENNIGYCSPPEHSRFKPGQSGNPKGRPKGSKNTDTLFLEMLDRKVKIKENGKPSKRSVRELLLKQAVNGALSGDLKSIVFLLNKIERIENKKAEIYKIPRVIFGDDVESADLPPFIRPA